MKTWQDLTEDEKQEQIDDGILDALFDEMGKSDVDECVTLWGEMAVAQVAYDFDATKDQSLIDDLESDLRANREEMAQEETPEEHLAWRNGL